MFLRLLILFISFTSYTQTQAEKNFGSWYMYHGNHALSKSWSINTGFQERNYQTFQN